MGDMKETTQALIVLRDNYLAKNVGDAKYVSESLKLIERLTQEEESGEYSGKPIPKV
jgi:hypothetical protein